MFEQEESKLTKDTIKIKVIGVGGGGNNAVGQMLTSPIEGIEYYIVNTEKGIIDRSKNLGINAIQIGPTVTSGLGAGANPEIGESAAKESLSEIDKILDGADLVFLTAGMGGGTGTGAIPIIAEEAKSRGIITVAIVTVPFLFEGRLRRTKAENGIEKLTAIINEKTQELEAQAQEEKDVAKEKLEELTAAEETEKVKENFVQLGAKAEEVKEDVVAETTEKVEEVKEAAEPVVEKAQEVAEPVVEKVQEVAEPAVEATQEASEPVIEKVQDAAKEVKEYFSHATEPTFTKVKGFTEEVKETAKTHYEEKVEPTFEQIHETVAPVIEKAEEVKEEAEEFVEEKPKTTLDSIVSLFASKEGRQ